MKDRLKMSILGILILITGIACSRKIYHPPALGAEYQFDRGLPPAKKTKQLFGKKMKKDLTEKGVFQKQQSPTVVTRKRGSTTGRSRKDSTSRPATDSTKLNHQAVSDSASVR